MWWQALFRYCRTASVYCGIVVSLFWDWRHLHFRIFNRRSLPNGASVYGLHSYGLARWWCLKCVHACLKWMLWRGLIWAIISVARLATSLLWYIAWCHRKLRHRRARVTVGSVSQRTCDRTQRRHAPKRAARSQEVSARCHQPLWRRRATVVVTRQTPRWDKRYDCTTYTDPLVMDSWIHGFVDSNPRCFI